MKKRITILVVVVIGLILAGFGGWQWWQGEVDFYREAMLKRGEELRGMAVKLTDARADLLNAQTELRQLEVALRGFQEAKTELELVKVEIQTVKEGLEVQRIYYEGKLIREFQRGEEAGHDKGYQEALERDVSRRNPTYREVESFLEGPALIFPAKKYICCVDAAALFDEVAEERGFRTGFVFLVFSYHDEGKFGHFINCFETPDRGRVYIEPGFRKEVKIEIGQPYPYTYFHGLVKEIIVVW